MVQETPHEDIPKTPCADETEAFFAQLLCRYRTPIVNLAYQLLDDGDEAEDVAQETFGRRSCT
ncbi:MAG: RNA polymerase sigma factor [Armatimonadota bacterium]